VEVVEEPLGERLTVEKMVGVEASPPIPAAAPEEGLAQAIVRVGVMEGVKEGEDEMENVGDTVLEVVAPPLTLGVGLEELEAVKELEKDPIPADMLGDRVPPAGGEAVAQEEPEREAE